MYSTSTHTAIYSFLRFSRAYAAERLPCFAPALFTCTIIVTDTVQVAAIDNKLNIYFNPKVGKNIQLKYELKLALVQIGFLWVHEISHVLRKHAKRAKDQSANSYWWNIAADLEINDSQWEGLSMPDDYPGLLPQQFNLASGQLTEYYYKAIEKQSPDYLPFFFDEGSGVHGESRPWETTNVSGNENIIIDQLILDVVRKEVAEEMKKWGRFSGSWSRWVNDVLQSKVDWRKVLRHRVKTAIHTNLMGKIDYSYKKINRRQSVFHPIILPALSGDPQARIAVIIDTSSSIHKTILRQAVGEICALLNSFKIPVTVIPTDAKAYQPIIIQSSSDYIKLMNLPGGGGTNMNAGIEAALILPYRPDVIIVLTDGYTPWPLKRLPIPVLFGILHLSKNHPTPPMPPWSADNVVGINLETL